MDDLIARLRSYGEPNPPCTPEQLQALSTELGCEIDPFLLALYADHDGNLDTRRTTEGEDGAERDEDLWFRLMPVGEVVDTHRAFQDLDFPTTEWRAFWTDDQSNYAACYVKGPLRGKVCLVQHDGMELAPRFRSARSFCAALVEAARADRDLEEYFADYPAIAASPEGDDEADRALALQLAAECRETDDEERREYLAHCAINVLPYSETELLVDFAGDEDPYLSERAEALLERRRIVAALPRLAELIRAGGRSSEARAELLRLLNEARSRLGTRVYTDLRDLGVEARTVRHGYQVRASPDAPWQEL